MKFSKLYACLLLLLAGFLQAASADLMVHEPYIRALPPGVSNSAVYMQLMNHGDQDVEVVGLSSSVSDSASVHETVEEDGMLRMRALDVITVPAHGTLELSPGGVHVMLMGLNQPLKEGDSVTLNLQLSDGESISVEVPVKNATAHSENQEQHHH